MKFLARFWRLKIAPSKPTNLVVFAKVMVFNPVYSPGVTYIVPPLAIAEIASVKVIGLLIELPSPPPFGDALGILLIPSIFTVSVLVLCVFLSAEADTPEVM